MDLRGIGRDFGRLRVLHDITVQLPPGRTAILGPNGAGKSTLLKILLGLLPPSRGWGRLLDVELTGPAADRRRLRQQVGLMPEGDALIPGLSGVEYVAFAGELCGLPRRQALRRAHEILGQLGLDEARYRRLEQYSTGMRQRVKLAQALVHDPQLLLLDEPTAGLDPAGREAMLRLIRQIATEQRKSVLLSTHVLGDVTAVCEQVVVLAAGQVRACGAVAELLQPRQRRFRLQVDGQRQAFAQALRQQQVQLIEVEVHDRQPWRIALPADCPPQRLFQLAVQHRAVIHSLSPDEETLEELFHRLVDSAMQTQPLVR